MKTTRFIQNIGKKQNDVILYLNYESEKQGMVHCLVQVSLSKLQAFIDAYEQGNILIQDYGKVIALEYGNQPSRQFLQLAAIDAKVKLGPTLVEIDTTS